ncbi:MAG: hypothetical protein MR992_03645 [Lachnospiraceae bacterium]|nr:hypothetical protein [Lachnospiraceae bacterium]MDD7629260.1 hypothetical protein [Lachnospiraceae bacterium]MDY4118053.1 hypothetical protein [Lachnospiraceae bacterium]
MSKTLKRLMTTVLTLAMMIGVFAVGGLQVKAAPTYELVAVGDDVTYEEAKALVSDNPSSQVDNEADSAFIPIIRELIPEAGLSSGNLVVFYNISTYGNINSAVWQSAYTGWTTMSNDFQYNDMKSSGFVYYYLVIHEDASQTSSSEPVKTEAPVHEHSYSWVTVQEATTEQDGMEEYRCSCGAVAERSVIPASQVFVKGLYGEVKNAPINGTVTFDSGRLYTMSDYIVKKIAERSDVTTVVTFEYNKTAYRMTIPAGADCSALLADEDYFYGYFYFAQLVGATIEEV